MVIVKREEADWFDGENERRGITRLELVRYAIQRLRETSPAGLPPDREIVTTDNGGVGMTVFADEDARLEFRNECLRLGTDESDLIRQALVRLRDGEPPSRGTTLNPVSLLKTGT
jgi:hypothetical protein